MLTVAVVLLCGAASAMEPGPEPRIIDAPQTPQPKSITADDKFVFPYTTTLRSMNKMDLCHIDSLDNGLIPPESCRNKTVCTEKPTNFDIGLCTDKYLQANKLMDINSPPPLYSLGEDRTLWGNILEYEDGVESVSELLSPYMLLDNRTHKVLYIVFQNKLHNQTIRTTMCRQEGEPCMKGAASEQYYAISVQKYSQIILDALNVYHQVVKIDFKYKSSCVCKYFPKRKCMQSYEV